MILFSAEAILASNTSKFGSRIPLTEHEDLRSSTESTISTSLIHSIACVGNCEQVHTSVLIFFQADSLRQGKSVIKNKQGKKQHQNLNRRTKSKYAHVGAANSNNAVNWQAWPTHSSTSSAPGKAPSRNTLHAGATSRSLTIQLLDRPDQSRFQHVQV